MSLRPGIGCARPGSPDACIALHSIATIVFVLYLQRILLHFSTHIPEMESNTKAEERAAHDEYDDENCKDLLFFL